MWQKYKELISSSIITLIGLVYFVMAFSIRQYGDAVLDSRFLPLLLGCLLIAFGTVKLVGSIRQSFHKDGGINSEPPEESGSSRHVMLTLILMIAYAFTMKPLGFLISTSAYMFLQTIILFPNKKKNYIIMISVSLIFSIAVYLVFVRIFSLVLPRGILG
jgi:hypothetical protein